MENEQELLEELSNCDIGELTEMMLLLEDEVSGNLKDCLTAYDLEQLEVIASNLLDGSEFMNLSKGKLIEKIVKEIYKLLENNLASLPQEILEDIEKLIKNPNYKIENKYLLAIGLVFGYYDEDDNVIYYIPEDVKQLFEQNISKEVKEDSLTSQIELYIQVGHICYGIVPKQELLYLADSNNKKQIEEILKKRAEEQETIKKGKEEFYLPLATSVPEELKGLEITPILLPMKTLVFYCMRLMSDLKRIEEVIKNVEDDFIEKATRALVTEPKKVSELVDYFSKIYSLNLKNALKLQEIIESMDYIRYWSLGGRTIEEEKALSYYLPQQPSDTSLKACLKGLPKDKLEELTKRYDVTSLEELEQKIIEYFKENQEELLDVDPLEFLDLDHENYEEMRCDPLLITHGCVFVYQTKNAKKLLIPAEIKTELKIYNEEYEEEQLNLDLEGYINIYLYSNGVIPKKVLQQILKEHHGFKYTIKELDELVKQEEGKSIKDYYSIAFDRFNEDMQALINEKERHPYKIAKEKDYGFLSLMGHFHDDLEDALTDTSFKDELISTIIYMLHYGLFDETFLKEFVREQHVSIPKNTWKELISVIKKYKNDIPLWPRNGYSYKELNSQSKAKKVGRNEPCVCGSGKKYKHCCGK